MRDDQSISNYPTSGFVVAYEEEFPPRMHGPFPTRDDAEFFAQKVYDSTETADAFGADGEVRTLGTTDWRAAAKEIRESYAG